MIMSNDYQFFCRDFWLPSDYESEKDGETFIFASNGLDLNIAGFSLINYCFGEDKNKTSVKYESLLQTLAFPLDLYGEEISFLSRNSAIALLNEISNKYSWELTCWLQNYIYPSWDRQGVIDIPRVIDCSTLFKTSSIAWSPVLTNT
ncbi:hypothetical protein A6770_25740 [Nostoc minutum NIES-26]|uniref:Uncharacterized protein n=1 Tax=Nostoc minutum NIES-26 TaxID=1844469 RepID=A0A367QTR1_9NOSO|nr:hypothetical protein A6770_25740 [Nostoc minutum NIES-26]